MNQKSIADAVIKRLKASGEFDSVDLTGSVAAGTHDSLSDIDLLVRSDQRPPWENVELASAIIEETIGCLLRDWAGSLIPEKYLISHFLPGREIMWWIDIGAMPDPAFGGLKRTDVDEVRHFHLAKLLIMNAKHFLRGRIDRLRVVELFRKVIEHDHRHLRKPEMFQAIYRAIDFSAIAPEFHRKTLEVMRAVINKSAEATP